MPPPAWIPASDNGLGGSDKDAASKQLLVLRSAGKSVGAECNRLPGGGENVKTSPPGAMDLGIGDADEAAAGRAARVEVADTLAMAEGIEDNPWSYHLNSQVQANLFGFARRLFAQEIQKLDVECLPAANGVLCLADLGCSSGMNTVCNMRAVYGELIKRYAAAGRSMPVETMAFFSDLPSNDFNSLFRLLTTPESGLAVAGGKESTPPGILVAGVPGSFYKKLFPRRMLHLVMSIFSVHWISHIPARLYDRDSPAFNRGGIWLADADRPEVQKEYSQQFLKDLSNFLVLRAKEVAKGGLVMLQLAAKKESQRPKPDWFPPFGEVLEDAWNQLVEDGQLDAAQRDAFNLPIYFPSVEEVKEAIQDANSKVQTSDRWEIKRLEYYKINPYGPETMLKADAQSFARTGCNMVRSVVNSLVQQHLGAAQTNALFQKMGEIAADRTHELISTDRLQHAGIVVILASR